MSKLVLIGGPPGVGKSSTLNYLPSFFEHCACLDADEVWRVHAPEINHALRPVAIRNITAVLRGYREAGIPYVFMAWPLANPDIIKELRAKLDSHYESVQVLHLIAAPQMLEMRCKSEPTLARNPEYALEKLRQIRSLPYQKVDTTMMSKKSVAERIAELVKK
ncbi:MAG: hypothetical protein AAF512_26550 [Pseudomonadota bacterium]